MEIGRRERESQGPNERGEKGKRDEGKSGGKRRDRKGERQSQGGLGDGREANCCEIAQAREWRKGIRRTHSPLLGSACP